MTNFEKIKLDIKNMKTAEQLADSQYDCVGWHCGHFPFVKKTECEE